MEWCDNRRVKPTESRAIIHIGKQIRKFHSPTASGIWGKSAAMGRKIPMPQFVKIPPTQAIFAPAAPSNKRKFAARRRQIYSQNLFNQSGPGRTYPAPEAHTRPTSHSE
ncbi:hypothetical protein Zmor_019883 [Zophobas morio]|uniref:Uncharacterized protein n=1 Tax=Zophobas morio TaxID=2755281 RepID=A0AA38I2S6_9CUCU|nr:hypothetical protein Zmor_019883 [Zophobas morio]